LYSLTVNNYLVGFRVFRVLDSLKIQFSLTKFFSASYIYIFLNAFFFTVVVKMEVLDEDEWWSKMEQMKLRGEQEIIMKRSFSRDDQQKLSDMAFELGLHL
jgi:hypothetical protein